MAISVFASASIGSAAVVDVTPDNMNGWAFIVESGAGSGQMVTGPGAPPLGIGSAELTAASTGDRILLATGGYAGVRFDSITGLQYSTYRSSGGSALAPSLQFDVDTDLTDTNTSWQGRLVYEPYLTQTVLDNTWQTWSPLTSGANWWFSGAPGNSVCTNASPCTWAQVLTSFPNAGIRVGGGTEFKAGGGWTNFVGNVDAFGIQLAGQSEATVFNFDTPEPSTWLTAAAGLVFLLRKKISRRANA